MAKKQKYLLKTNKLHVFVIVNYKLIFISVNLCL